MAIRIGGLNDLNMVANKVDSVRRGICATPIFLNEIAAITQPKDLTNFPCIHFTGLIIGIFIKAKKSIRFPLKDPLLLMM